MDSLCGGIHLYTSVARVRLLELHQDLFHLTRARREPRDDVVPIKGLPVFCL